MNETNLGLILECYLGKDNLLRIGHLLYTMIIDIMDDVYKDV